MYLRVISTDERTVTCEARNSATLGGLALTVHLANVHTRIPNLTSADVAAIGGWGVRNSIDFLSLSFTTCAAEVHAARALLQECGLADTHILAKIETREGLCHLDEIADAADGIILRRVSYADALLSRRRASAPQTADAACLRDR